MRIAMIMTVAVLPLAKLILGSTTMMNRMMTDNADNSYSGYADTSGIDTATINRNHVNYYNDMITSQSCMVMNLKR